MPCGEAHKNVVDCRTSFLGTRSKGKAHCTKALVDEEFQVLILENKGAGSGDQRQNAILMIRLARFCTLQDDSAQYSAGYGPKLDPSSEVEMAIRIYGPQSLPDVISPKPPVGVGSSPNHRLNPFLLQGCEY